MYTHSWQVSEIKAAYAAGIHKENELYREEQHYIICNPVPIRYKKQMILKMSHKSTLVAPKAWKGVRQIAQIDVNNKKEQQKIVFKNWR